MIPSTTLTPAQQAALRIAHAIEAIQAWEAQHDTVEMTCKIIGDAMRDENELINSKLAEMKS
jgi:hypothetical protein